MISWQFLGRRIFHRENPYALFYGLSLEKAHGQPRPTGSYMFLYLLLSRCLIDNKLIIFISLKSIKFEIFSVIWSVHLIFSRQDTIICKTVDKLPGVFWVVLSLVIISLLLGLQVVTSWDSGVARLISDLPDWGINSRVEHSHWSRYLRYCALIGWDHSEGHPQ